LQRAIVSEEEHTAKEEEEKIAGLSPGKRSILKLLKIHGESSLAELAEILSVSKMAVLKHLTKLEDAGLVQRRAIHKGDLGRPVHRYKLTTEGTELFPRAYSDIALCALSFIEQRQGRAAVSQMLRIRQKELFEKYNDQVQGKTLPERVFNLTELRDKDGYMAQSRSLGRSTFEILEHNCPIAALAQKYNETCATETELFRLLLQTDVEVSHRVVAGDPVCRFLVKKKNKTTSVAGT